MIREINLDYEHKLNTLLIVKKILYGLNLLAWVWATIKLLIFIKIFSNI